MLKKSSYCISIFFLTSTLVLAQGQGKTPYSILGFGELSEPTDAVQDMMGGTGASFSNGFYVNTLNPALLSKNRTIGDFKYVSFNVGLRGNYRSINQGNKITNNFGFNLQNLGLTVPISKQWATSFSVRPYSMVDYTYTSGQVLNVGGIERGINYRNNYSGGISRASWANGVSFWNKLYVGLETFYNFGSISKDSTQVFVGDINQQRVSNRYALGGLGYRAGVAYQQKVSKNWRVNVGAVLEASSNLRNEQVSTFGLFQDAGQGPALITAPDTLSFISNRVSTPSQQIIGISLEKPYHWLFAADFGRTLWSGVNTLDTFGNFYKNDASYFSAGAEWLPNSTSTNYFNQIFYRLGYYSSQTQFSFESSRIRDQRISLGLSMPMGFRSPSYLNLAVAFGRRGVLEGNLIQENYIRISTSVSLLSPWFIKPRID